MEITPESKKEYWDAYLSAQMLSIGLASGAMISAERIQVLDEAQEKLAPRDEQEPPEPTSKPPWPNAGIGGIALGNT